MLERIVVFFNRIKYNRIEQIEEGQSRFPYCLTLKTPFKHV